MGSNLTRTVTFADLDVVEYLKKHFVVVWHNQSPEIYAQPGQQENPSPETAKAYPEGGGGSNVRSYFCNSSGEVLCSLEGYWSPQRYLAESKFAAGLESKVKPHTPQPFDSVREV